MQVGPLARVLTMLAAESFDLILIKIDFFFINLVYTVFSRGATTTRLVKFYGKRTVSHSVGVGGGIQILVFRK